MCRRRVSGVLLCLTLSFCRPPRRGVTARCSVAITPPPTPTPPPPPVLLLALLVLALPCRSSNEPEPEMLAYDDRRRGDRYEKLC